MRNNQRPQSTMTLEPTDADLARQGRIEWFERLKEGQRESVTSSHDLLVELQLGDQTFEEMRTAAARYMAACLGRPELAESINDLETVLERNVDRLANRTPNGIVVPKLEFQDEFNECHRVMADWLRDLRKDELILSAFCPITVRVVKGQSDPAAHLRPYTATKIHVDLWNGEPTDFVAIFVPVFGDIARTTIQFFDPPSGFESTYLRVLDNYEEAAGDASGYSLLPLELKKGCAYFVDAIVPHRTFQRGGTARATVEFRVRRRTEETERKITEATCDPRRLAQYQPLADWYPLGSTRKMCFVDTYADAQRGVFTEEPYKEATYRIVDA